MLNINKSSNDVFKPQEEPAAKYHFDMHIHIHFDTGLVFVVGGVGKLLKWTLGRAADRADYISA